jgi:2-methylcitrate dehydratase
MALQGEMGYPTALSAPQWGFYAIFSEGKPFVLQKPFGSYVMENILFKVSFPAEFHAQTAVECAITMHPHIHDRIEQIAEIQIQTQEAAVRIIDKQGPLYNAADRDHCLQYMVAMALLKGTLEAKDYEEENARDPRIDKLRSKMKVFENPQFTQDYLDPQKRAISNAMYIRFTDGSHLGPVIIEYPIGHQRRRKEALPLLLNKFSRNFSSGYPASKVDELIALFLDPQQLLSMAVSDFVNLFPTVGNFA